MNNKYELIYEGKKYFLNDDADKVIIEFKMTPAFNALKKSKFKGKGKQLPNKCKNFWNSHKNNIPTLF